MLNINNIIYFFKNFQYIRTLIFQNKFLFQNKVNKKELILMDD